MTYSERPWPAGGADADSDGPAASDTDWWRGDADDWPGPGDPPPPAPLGAPPGTALGAAPATAPGTAPTIVDAELVDADDDPVRVAGLEPDLANLDDSEVEIGELIDGPPPAARPVDEPRPAPRPFATAPRTVPRIPMPPLPPQRPTGASVVGPVLGPVPVPPPPEPAASAVHPGLPTQRRAPGRPRRAPSGRRRPATSRRIWLGIPALVLLALSTAFLGWVSAEPLWLAVGHDHAGTATVVASSTGCRASFIADGGAFTASTVDLSGVDTETCAVGAVLPARMVSADSGRAYALDQRGLSLRVGVGYGLILLGGLLIALVSGAHRMRGWRRLTSTGVSVLGPALVAAAMLALTY